MPNCLWSGMDAEGLQAFSLEYRSASKVLSGEDLVCTRLAEVLKAHLINKCYTVFEQCKHQACLFSCSCDATSFLCQAQASATVAGETVCRKGKVLHEFLMQRGYLKCMSATGQERTALLFTDPVPFSEVKKCWNLFESGCRFFPLLPHTGHLGTCIFHLAADRAVQTPLQRMLHQRLEGFYTEGLGPQLGEEGPLLHLTGWFITTPCSLHDIQNSLKWAMSSSGGPEVVGDLHIIAESLRNSLSLLRANLHHFLITPLAFNGEAYDLDAVMEF